MSSERRNGLGGGFIDRLRSLFSGRDVSYQRLPFYFTLSQLYHQFLSGGGVKSHIGAVQLGYYFYSTSTPFRTVIEVLVRETFRNGLEYVENGKVVEMSDELKKVLEDISYENSFLAVLKSVYLDVNITGNGFLVTVFDYEYNDYGEIVDRKVARIVRGDPEYFELILSNDGRPALSLDGKQITLFCPEHRTSAKLVDVDFYERYEEPPRCHCGKILIPAHYRYSHSMAGYIYYAKDEVIHIKKWSIGIGLGSSPILALSNVLFALQAQEQFIAQAWSRGLLPNRILFIRGHSRNLQNAIQQARQTYAENPYEIPVLAVDSDVAVEKLIDTVDLAPQIRETELVRLRDEFRATILAIYGVTAIFTGDTKGVGGLNAEGMQVLVTNRTVSYEQSLINEALVKVSRYLGLNGTLRLKKNEVADLDRVMEQNQKVLDIADRLTRLGYEVEIEQSEDGRLSFRLGARVREPEVGGRRGAIERVERPTRETGGGRETRPVPEGAPTHGEEGAPPAPKV